MADEQNEYSELFNPKPVGERVNMYVHEVAPQKTPDYSAMQRLIDESPERIFRTSK